MAKESKDKIIKKFKSLFGFEPKNTKLVEEKVLITEIKENDYIKGFDTESNTNKFEKVLEVMDPIVKKEDQLRISFEKTSTTVITSKIHPMPFWDDSLNNWSYKPSQEIKKGDIVLFENKVRKVKDIDFNYSEDEKFIDFEVENINNYFISNNGKDFVLVHNSRQGACAVYFNWWDYEVKDLIYLKDEGGSEEKRARKLQYSIKINKILFERAINNEEITLFNPKDVPELIEAFGDEFEKLYLQAEEKIGIRKKKINARDLLYHIAKVRLETGNLYIFFDDNANAQTPFEEYVNSSNLCLAGDTKIKVKRNNIEQVIDLKDAKKGDLVLSKNLKTDKVEYKKIIDFAMTSPKAKVLKITDSKTGKTIICTPDHKIWTKNRGYVEAKNLKPDDILDIQE